MDVGNPISSVIPSLDGAVLGALAGTAAPMNLSRVHEVGGRGSLSGVRRVLVRLVGTGVVLEVPGGYLLNREHVAARAVEGLAHLWGDVFDRIRTHVGEWPESPRLVGVFGSAARRDGGDDSDIDLLVVSDAIEAAERAAELRGAYRAVDRQCHPRGHPGVKGRPADATRPRADPGGVGARSRGHRWGS